MSLKLSTEVNCSLRFLFQIGFVADLLVLHKVNDIIEQFESNCLTREILIKYVCI